MAVERICYWNASRIFGLFWIELRYSLSDDLLYCKIMQSTLSIWWIAVVSLQHFSQRYSVNPARDSATSQHAWLKESISQNLPKPWHKESNLKFEQPMRQGSNMRCYRCLWLELQIERCIPSVPAWAECNPWLSFNDQGMNLGTLKNRG